MKTCTNRIPDNCDSYECGRPEVRAGRCEACLPGAIAEARTSLRAMERATGEARARLRDLEGTANGHAKRLAEAADVAIDACEVAIGNDGTVISRNALEGIAAYRALRGEGR